MPDSIEEQKWQLRREMRSLRRDLPQERRDQAANILIDRLAEIVSNHSYILSFMPIGYEIDVFWINLELALWGQLALPRMAETADGKRTLHCFHVEQPWSQLEECEWQPMYEPNPALCDKLDPKEISLVLVPGLAFDGTCHRLGYGKGYYDHFLSTLTKDTLCLGVGYQELFVETPLPLEPHDWPLDGLLLT